MVFKICITLSFIFALTGCHINKEPQPKTEQYGNITLTQNPIPNTEKSSIQGLVIDLKTGEPILGAKVNLTNTDGITLMGTITNEEGKFQLKSIENGTYQLKINLIGFSTLDFPIKIEKATSIEIQAKLEEAPLNVLKPIIYLYPIEKSAISVQLNYDGKLDHTYPKYPTQGWKIIAEPNGTLWDEKGLEYYALFWEGTPNQPLNAATGFVVPGAETASFLEDKLDYLGLNRREANEFIMFWLPKMENNPYNLIHFAGETYEKQAELIIKPQPETTIRVMMLTQALEHKIDIPTQDLSKLKKTRKGFTVVEWGGSELPLIKL